jgi:hypothetical protein
MPTPEPELQKLRDQVRDLIRVLGLAQIPAAQRLGISQGHLCHVLAGTRPLRGRTQKAFATFVDEHRARLPTTTAWREGLATATMRDDRVVELIAHIMHNLEELKGHLQDGHEPPGRPKE